MSSFLKTFFSILGVPNLNINSICQLDSPYRKKADNFGEIELKPGTLCCILVNKISWKPYDNGH